MKTSLGVLVIDDNFIVKKTLTMAIERCGSHQVHLAENGQVAFDLIEQHHIDLVFCDLQMPELDGVSFLEQLSKRNIALKVVLMSGVDQKALSSAEQLALSLDIQLLGCFEKPLQLEQVSEVISQALVESSATTVKTKDPEQISEHLLRECLQNNYLNVKYQPYFKVDTEQLVGFEALARIQHPDEGEIFPNQFIPVAERSDLIAELTYQVLTTAIHDLQRLNNENAALRMSVNLSAKVAENAEFIDRVFNLCNLEKLSPNQLTLELTETALCQSHAELCKNMIRLKLLGYRLAIDDFGTGYSTLESLRALPFDELKVDMQFVRNMHQNELNRKIVKNCLRFASDLSLSSVIEGVELSEHFELIKQMGGDTVQGFLFSKPVALDVLINEYNLAIINA